MLKQKIAYIDLSTGDIKTRIIPERVRRLYLGARLLDMYLLYNHIEPGIDPLGPKNVLMVSAGILGGTPVPAPSRTHVAALAPETRCVGSSNMGGFFGPELRFAGFDELVIKGQAEKPVYLWVHDGEIEIRDAAFMWGKNIMEMQPLIKKELKDEDVQALCIGQAGENLVKFACVRTGLKSTGGRTGMGCVMGSKKLKAVVARGTQDIELFDPEKALELCFQANEAGWDSRSANVRKRWGKSYFYGNTNTFGGIRTRNFELNQLVGGDDLECENMDRFAIGREACFGCQQHCRHRFKITVGPFKGAYASGPDYTTIGAVGTELDVRSMDVCLAAGAMCDTYGMDNMGLGSMLSWAMELYEKGIITIKDTGIPLEWGDPDTIFEMIKRIALREGFGDVLADGPEGAIRRIGEESRYYNINMKGMSNMHSDERATPSFALGVATSTRGPDHLRSRPIPDLYGLPEDVLEKMYGGGPMSSDYTSYVGKARMVYSTEIRCASQGLGTCGGTGDMVKAIYYITGMEFTREELLLMGERVYNIERMFNCREGRTRADDYPPERYFTEPSPLGLPKVRGKCLDREKYDQMLDEYYDLHGWDRNGVPTPETLKRLGLDKEPSHLL